MRVVPRLQPTVRPAESVAVPDPFLADLSWIGYDQYEQSMQQAYDWLHPRTEGGTSGGGGAADNKWRQKSKLQSQFEEGTKTDKRNRIQSKWDYKPGTKQRHRDYLTGQITIQRTSQVLLDNYQKLKDEKHVAPEEADEEDYPTASQAGAGRDTVTVPDDIPTDFPDDKPDIDYNPDCQQLEIIGIPCTYRHASFQIQTSKFRPKSPNGKAHRKGRNGYNPRKAHRRKQIQYPRRFLSGF